MRKLSVVLFILSCGIAVSSAGEGKKKQEIRLDRVKIAAVVHGDEFLAKVRYEVKPFHGQSTLATGPGVKLMESFFDYGSNGGVLTNLHDYGDGTLAVGRMGAASPDLIDRGTYFSFFDGTTWSPMAKVEQGRRGWSSIAALHDGRSVAVSQSGNEVNVDSAKGAGVWGSYLTNGATSAAVQWPRFVIDGQDNIIICSTTNATINGVTFIKQVNVSRDRGQTWQHAFLWPDTTARKPAFSADDQAIDAFGDNVAIAVCEVGGDIHLWTSADNGATWAYKNVTNHPHTLPPGTEALRGAGTVEVLYDGAGNLHLFWENYLARPGSGGEGLDLYESTEDPILHWSAATGISPVARFSQISGAEDDSLVFVAGGSFDQINADGALLKQPQAGVDAEGNLYLMFAAFRPNDLDIESAHFTDLYAVGSKDGGKTWGVAVNVTNTPQSEDLWASLADQVGDSLRFLYQSDGNTGNNFIGGGAAPTTFLYHAYARSNIPLGAAAINTRTGEVPTIFALEQNYPNPFNPSTAIAFSLPTNVNVTLEVYSLLGQKVATLVDSKLAAGNHTFTWNAQNAPSGLYFYRLEAKGFSQIRKMLLLQ
ncbi:MAG: T9SS type A sorting domain-containing protein [bacterium]